MYINLTTLNEILDENINMFVAGNGFSINFDKGFYNIYDNLDKAHKNVIHKTKYEIKSGNAFKKKYYDNLDAVMRYIRFYKKKDIEKIFEDGIKFSSSIVDNEELLALFNKNDVLTSLTFGMSELDILKELQYAGSKKGYKYVNIEYWTILVYFYYVIKDLPVDGIYKFPENNSFLTLVKLGDSSNIKLMETKDTKSYAMTETISNGFSIYYRLLFINAAFNNGKAIDVTKLDNYNVINKGKLKELLSKFHSLATLNYDNILESIIGKDVVHLHGKFNIETKSYVYNQSIQILYKDLTIDASDIIIGDYFIYKTLIPVINKLSASQSSNKNNINKEVEYIGDILKNEIKKYAVNSISLFGINVINDYHILRNIMIELYCAYSEGIIRNPQIVYFYHSEKSKKIFESTFDRVITFSDELNDFVRDIIDIYFVSTKEVLDEYFF